MNTYFGYRKNSVFSRHVWVSRNSGNKYHMADKNGTAYLCDCYPSFRIPNGLCIPVSWGFRFKSRMKENRRFKV